MKIVFVTRHLSQGGAERAVADIATYWAERGRDVTVVVYGPASVNEYPLGEGVRRVDLGLARRHGWRRYAAALATVRAVRRLLQEVRPDVVVSMNLGPNLVAAAATVASPVPVIAQETVHFPALPHNWRARVARRLLYRRLSRLVVLSERTRAAASALAGPTKVAVIPRHLSPSVACPPARDDAAVWQSFGPGLRPVRIVGVGRLEPQKGFDILLHALALLRADDRWCLAILGDGPQHDALKQLSAALELGDRVLFAGWRDPRPTLTSATVFAFPSRFEGFGQALVEAMAHGLAVVAADCPAGPSDIITPGENGLLVPPENPEALARAIATLIDDEVLRAALGRAARAVRETYAMDNVMAMWEELLPAPSKTAPS